jgi:hypothetical protein
MATATFGYNSTNTYQGSAGASFKENAPTTNYAGAHIECGKFGAANWTHAVIFFGSLANLPANAIISNVTLYLNLASQFGTATHTISLRRSLRDWVTVQMTWNIWATGQPWAIPGGTGSGTDRIATISGSGSIGTTLETYYALTGAGMVTDVQNWVNGTDPNLGWHLERTDGQNDSTTKYFYTDSGANGPNGKRPYLEVTYSLPTTGMSGRFPQRLTRRPNAFAGGGLR